MAVVSTQIDAVPAAVFAVLADGWCYSNWVVGTSHVRAVEKSWPQPGSTLFHASGVWPLVTRDVTIVRDVQADRRLELIARGRPFGAARIVLELEPRLGGTHITLAEHPISGPGNGCTTPPPTRCWPAATPSPLPG